MMLKSGFIQSFTYFENIEYKLFLSMNVWRNSEQVRNFLNVLLFFDCI